MNENTDEPISPLDTVSTSPIGSPASRAAARAAAGASGAPIVITEYVTGTRGDDDVLRNPRCLSKTADVNGKRFDRSEGESDEDFRERCFAACWVFKWNFITMHGDADQ
jgi:hypothetical protein